MSGDFPHAAELVFRQVHPSFLRNGRPTSQAFRPTKKDNGFLSVARESLTTAAAAYQLHVGPKDLKSAGSWAVSVGECEVAGVPLVADPLTEPVEDAAHTLIDFSALSVKQQEAQGAVLGRAATVRGRLFPVPDDPSGPAEPEAPVTE